MNDHLYAGRFAVVAALLVGWLAMTVGHAETKGSSLAHKKFEAFTVIGISARTDNAKEVGADGVIPKQWQKFFQEGVLGKIPAKLGPEIYAVYTDYASDHNGEYTYVIGAKVKQGTPAPEGMVAVNVPAGSYAILTSDKGPLPRVVPAAWQSVFQLEDTGKLHRAYKSDFELYDRPAQKPEDAQVDLYIGVK